MKEQHGRCGKEGGGGGGRREVVGGYFAAVTLKPLLDHYQLDLILQPSSRRGTKNLYIPYPRQATCIFYAETISLLLLVPLNEMTSVDIFPLTHMK